MILALPGTIQFVPEKREVIFRQSLSGAIPPELGNTQSSLQALELNGNNLSGPIPNALINLSSLQKLWLHDIPNLVCWETQEARDWALGLPDYMGPTAVCP